MRFTPLEIAVLDALADEIVQVPDLDAQIEEARPSARRNTGQGFVTEIVVDRSRPLAPQGQRPSGTFGTIHADVEGLIDPMAFQIVLREGRIMSLRGQTYDEHTRAIDFTTARFWGLFFIGPSGESLPVRPHAAARTTVQRLSDEAAQPITFPAVSEPVPTPAPLPVEPDDLTANGGIVVAGLIAAVVFIAIIAVLVFNMPFFFGLVMVVVTANALRNPKVRETAIKAFAALREQSQAPRG